MLFLGALLGTVGGCLASTSFLPFHTALNKGTQREWGIWPRSQKVRLAVWTHQTHRKRTLTGRGSEVDVGKLNKQEQRTGYEV